MYCMILYQKHKLLQPKLMNNMVCIFMVNCLPILNFKLPMHKILSHLHEVSDIHLQSFFGCTDQHFNPTAGDTILIECYSYLLHCHMIYNIIYMQRIKEQL